MALPLEDHVRQILLENERGAKFHQAIHDGWASFCEQYPQRHRWRRKATMRNMVWEEIVQRIMQVAGNDAGIKPLLHRDTMSLIVEDEVLLRVKHADAALVTRNYPTSEAQEFDQHDIDLYGYGGLQRVKLCYVPDEFESQLIWVGVAATSYGRHLWKIELNSGGAVVPAQRLPMAQPEVDTTKIARVKKPVTKESQNKKNERG